MQYRQLYEKGVLHMDSDLQDTLRSLAGSECVCLSSAKQMGDARFMDYVAFVLSRGNEYDVLYDVDGVFTEEVLEDLSSSKSRKKPVVLILPHFESASEGFVSKLESLVKLNSRRVLAVIRIPYGAIASDAQKFMQTGKLLSYVKIRKPIDFEMTRSVIESRRQLNNWEIPEKFEKEIHRLSGGLFGLIKYSCSYVDKYSAVDIGGMLKYPAIKRGLAILEEQFRTLETDSLVRLGLMNKDGSVPSVLLSRHLSRSKLVDDVTLSPMLSRLLELLVSNRGSVVTLDQIEDHLKDSGDYSYWGNYKAISRLRKVVRGKYEIRNVKGQGYVLLEK